MTEPYHVQLSENSQAQYARAVVTMALYDARNGVKRKIKSEGL
jgi:hypothetical protein